MVSCITRNLGFGGCCCLLLLFGVFLFGFVLFSSTEVESEVDCDLELYDG